MTKAKTGWLLLGILCLASFAVAQSTAWEKYIKAGTEAYQRGQYAEAEKQALAALQEAEKFGPNDQRFAISLLFLGRVYQDQGQYSRAEPLYQRSLAIWEKALGSEHPNVATGLENYAKLLRKTNREAEAAKLEARAKAIRDKHAAQNPPK